jgi:hypothetical protein
MNLRTPVLFLIAAGLGLMCSSANAAGTCFAASKIYAIHRLHGGADTRDGWAVEGDAFAQCVHRAEAADKALHVRYPDAVFNLSLAATIGCHSPCN